MYGCVCVGGGGGEGGCMYGCVCVRVSGVGIFIESNYRGVCHHFFPLIPDTTIHEVHLHVSYILCMKFNLSRPISTYTMSWY